MTTVRYLRRDDAARHMRETWALPCSPKWLAKLAVIGGGPIYRKAGRTPIYAPADLDACGHRPTAFCHRSRPTTTASVTKFCERRALVEGDMVSLGALYLILRNVGVRVMRIAPVLDIAHMHANDRAADPSGLGIPTHMIADLEGFGHDGSVQCFAMGLAAAFRVLRVVMRQKRALSSINSTLS